MSENRRRAARAIASPAGFALASGLLGIAILAWAPPGPDTPAHLYEIAAFRALGYRAWDNLWYGGSYTQVGYSLIFAPAAAALGLTVLAGGSAALASGAFAGIARRRWPDHWAPAAVAFALLAPTPILWGQFPFMLGCGFGLAALWALQAGSVTGGVALLLLCSASSPLALLFTLVPLAAAAMTTARWWRTRRLVAGAAGILAVVAGQVVLQLAFGRAGASYPSGISEALQIALLCAAGLILCGTLPGQRVMRGTFVAYALLGAALLVVPLTVGGNSLRLALYMGTPLLLVPVAARRFRPFALVLPVLALAIAWQGAYLVNQVRADSASPGDARAAFWAPTARFLLRHGDPGHRVEVVATAGKWESYRLAALGIPLARGWFRQDDWPQNGVLYGRLSRASYRAWLRDMGVRYVVLPDTHRDVSARAEALLVDRGGVLPLVARLPDAKVYELPRATPIATPAAGIRIRRLDPQSVTLRILRPGTYRLRLSYTPYWSVSGPACVAPRAPWGTVLRAAGAGRVVLRFHVTADRMLDSVTGADGARARRGSLARDQGPRASGGEMTYVVDFTAVSTTGLESSPVADALAGLRANEARYFRNKYDHVFAVEPADEAQETIAWVRRILEEERDIVISSRPLEATAFEADGIRFAYVFYESGLSVNVMYALEESGKRAVGFKLSDGMEVPEELASRFKFARQRSKLAGTIRGSYFVIKNEY